MPGFPDSRLLPAVSRRLNPSNRSHISLSFGCCGWWRLKVGDGAAVIGTRILPHQAPTNGFWWDLKCRYFLVINPAFKRSHLWTHRSFLSFSLGIEETAVSPGYSRVSTSVHCQRERTWLKLSRLLRERWFPGRWPDPWLRKKRYNGQVLPAVTNDFLFHLPTNPKEQMNCGEIGSGKRQFLGPRFLKRKETVDLGPKKPWEEN